MHTREAKMYKLNNLYGSMDYHEIENLIRFSKFPNWLDTLLKYTEHLQVANQVYTISEHVEVSFREKKYCEILYQKF